MNALSSSREEDDVLDFDISHWPAQVNGRTFTLKLEGLTYGGVEGESRSRLRNMFRLEEAKKREDIVNLSIHYSCCIDGPLLEAIMGFLKCKSREWISFTMTGINEVGNLYSHVEFSAELQSLLQALKQIRVLKLHSSNINTGHGLEVMLKEVPSLSNLEELHLEGWEIDRISATTLINSLEDNSHRSIRLLSLRSCRFLGENTFPMVCVGLKGAENLSTLDLSYCSLCDTEIIPLVGLVKAHPSIQFLDLEKNNCQNQSSLDVVAEWIGEDDCKLQGLNVGTLWAGFSEDGLLVRFVDPKPFFSALTKNTSLRYLNVSGNYLDNKDIQQLTQSLSSQNWSCALRSLDVGVNPFDEKSALSLLQFVRENPTIQTLELENPFIKYKCAQLIKIQTEANFFGSFIQKSEDIPLSLWPTVIARVQKGQKPKRSKDVSELSTDHIYRLLRSSSGSYGKQLSFRIALQSQRKQLPRIIDYK